MKTKLLFLSAAFVFLTACQSTTDEKAEDTSAEKEEKTEQTTEENEKEKDEAKENKSTQTDTLDKGTNTTQGEVTTEHYSNVVDGIEVDIELTADKENNILLTLHQVEKIPYEYYNLKSEEEAEQLVKDEIEHQEQKHKDFSDDVARYDVEHHPEEKMLVLDKYYDYSDPENIQKFVANGVLEGEGNEKTVMYDTFIESLKDLGIIEDDSTSKVDKEALQEQALHVADKKDIEKYDKYYFESNNEDEEAYRMYVVDTKNDKILYEVQHSAATYSTLNLNNQDDVKQFIEEHSKVLADELKAVSDETATFEIVNDEENEMIRQYHIINYDSPKHVNALNDAGLLMGDPESNSYDYVGYAVTKREILQSDNVKEVK